MALIQANIYSNTLNREVNLDLILPQRTEKIVGTETPGYGEGEVPVLYLLHGMNGNHSVWHRRTSIERYVNQLGIAVVMPSVDLAWYTDTQYGLDYWTYIADELPLILQELFPQLSSQREKTFVAGASMGGYGAVKLGLRRPERFAGVASLSGAVAIAEDTKALLGMADEAYWEGIFGPLIELKGSQNDPIHLLETVPVEKAPRFYLTCGTEDFLYSSSEYFVSIAQKRGLDVTFESGPGEHNWAFWDEWIHRVLTWMFPTK